MFILIVGGGKVGTYLSRALIQQGHEVVVVEKSAAKAKMSANILEEEIAIVGDGCDPVVLQQAGIERADVVIADTGDDEDNLVVSLIAKKQTNKPRCIARVNNPRNKMIFESLDPTDPVLVISSTEIILSALNEHVKTLDYKSVMESMYLFDKGNMVLVKIAVPQRSTIEGKRISDITFPRNSVVVAVDRNDSDLVIPTGETRVKAGDSIVVIAKKGSEEQVRSALATPAAV